MEMVLHPTKQNIHTTKQRTQRVLTQVTTQNVENLLPNDNTPRKESKDERGFHRLRLVDMSFVIKSNQVVNPPLLIPLLGQLTHITQPPKPINNKREEMIFMWKKPSPPHPFLVEQSDPHKRMLEC